MTFIEYWSDEHCAFIVYDDSIESPWEVAFKKLKKKLAFPWFKFKWNPFQSLELQLQWKSRSSKLQWNPFKPFATLLFIFLGNFNVKPSFAYDKSKFATLSTLSQIDHKDNQKKMVRIKNPGKGRKLGGKSFSEFQKDQKRRLLQIEKDKEWEKNRREKDKMIFPEYRKPLTVDLNGVRTTLGVETILERYSFTENYNLKPEFDSLIILSLVLIKMVQIEKLKILKIRGGKIPIDPLRASLNKLLDFLPFGIRQTAKFIINQLLDLIFNEKNKPSKGSKGYEALIALFTAGALRFFWEDLKKLGIFKKKNRFKLRQWLEENWQILLLISFLFFTKKIWWPLLFTETVKENEKTSPNYYLGISLKETIDKISEGAKLEKNEKQALSKQLYNVIDSERKKNDDTIQALKTQVQFYQMQRESFMLSSKDGEKEIALLKKDISYVTHMVNTCKDNYNILKNDLDDSQSQLKLVYEKQIKMPLLQNTDEPNNKK